MNKKIENIEELLKSRRHSPLVTLKLFKDACRRIKKMEKSLKTMSDCIDRMKRLR